MNAALRVFRRLLLLATFVFVGGAFGKIAVLLASMVHAPSPTAQTLIIGLGAVLGGWIGATMNDGSSRLGSGVHGSARFASHEEIRATLGGPAGLIVGRENRKGGQLLRYAGQAHLLTIAPTRSGKGVGAIIPNLLTADRSVLCVDPKCENARITAAGRARFGPVYVLDPFEVSGQPSAAFNPLDGLNPNSPDLAEDAALLADALVHDPPDQGGEAHWNEEAKALIGGVSDGRNLDLARRHADVRDQKHLDLDPPFAPRADDARRDHAAGFQFGDPTAPRRRARHRREGPVLRRPGVPGAVHHGERLNDPASVYAYTRAGLRAANGEFWGRRSPVRASLDGGKPGRSPVPSPARFAAPRPGIRL